MTTTHGIRFELLRVDEASLRYRIELQGPGETWRGEATIQPEDGAVGLGPFEPSEPPSWAITTLKAFLRGEWRARRDDPELAWPRRITRWRAER